MDAEKARALFDENAETYDRVNTVISLGLDGAWRRWAARRAVRGPGDRVLDAFAGTGLVGIEADRLGADVTLADVSEGMLARARRNALRHGAVVRTAVADLAHPPLPLHGGYDAITLSFGLRYLDDPVAVMTALRELLRPGGRIIVLEFVRPPRRMLSRLAAAYYFRVLPRLASLLAGRAELYDYLRDSTMHIGTAEDVARMVADAGFRVIERREAGFGIVTGVVGECR